jgi:hypothetical protein
MPNTNPLPCSNSVMVYNATSGEIVFLDTGNYPGQSNYCNETVTWLHSAENWTVVSTSQVDPLGPLPVRSQQGMGFDNSSLTDGYCVVLFGGQGGSETAGVLDDTWTASSVTAPVWTKQTPGTTPFGRYRHSMANLDGYGTLMFGGSNVLNFLQETWLWSGGNGGDWVQLTPGTVPPVRVDFAMAGNVVASPTPPNVLMFGGKGTATSLGDTWVWVGNANGNWVLQTPAVSPPPLSGACMAYDVTHSTYVLFGGENSEGLITPPTTWLWTGGNGGNWAEVVMPNGTGPAARVGAQMAWDGTQIVMFGGYGTASNVFQDTWGWNGSTWTQL